MWLNNKHFIVFIPGHRIGHHPIVYRRMFEFVEELCIPTSRQQEHLGMESSYCQCLYFSTIHANQYGCWVVMTWAFLQFWEMLRISMFWAKSNIPWTYFSWHCTSPTKLQIKSFLPLFQGQIMGAGPLPPPSPPQWLTEGNTVISQIPLKGSQWARLDKTSVV